MRISLTEDGRNWQRKKRGLWRRRRRSWALDSSITIPQPRSGRRLGQKGRTKGDDRARPRRARREQPAAQPAAQSPARALQSIRWPAVLLRLAGVLVLVALVGLIAYVSVDAQFFVYGAQIVGAHHLAPEVIYQVAGVHEQNIFWLDPQKVAQRVVQLVGIKAVRVRCELPALVTIEVEEREPVLMWRATTQMQDLWLDGEGIVLPYHGDANSPDMIFVVDYGERHLEVGDRIQPEGIVPSVLQLAGTLPGVRVFHYQPERGLSFTHHVATGEWPVYVGTSEDLARKIQVVQAITGYLQANGIGARYVDVRWADHPVFGRPIGETAEGGD